MVIGIVIIFVLFFVVGRSIERQLQERVTQPIILLTEKIKDPKKFNEQSIKAKEEKKDEKKGKTGDENDEDARDKENGERTTDGQEEGGNFRIEPMRGKQKDGKNDAIDEIRALESIFFDFFGNQTITTNVLVEMSRHEYNLNPFYAEKKAVEGE